jgi:hypothetical protein
MVTNRKVYKCQNTNIIITSFFPEEAVQQLFILLNLPLPGFDMFYYFLNKN